ncbi:YkyA family protein [Halobacillus sp. MO56]
MSLRKLYIPLTLILVVLAACNNGPAPEEQIYEHLEKAVSLEEEFRKQQQPIVELERKEQELYNKIINLSMEEFDQIKEYSQEAAGLVEERQQKIELEKESIDAAKQEFDKIEPLIDDLDEEEQAGAKEKAKALVETMNNRYDAYQQLYEDYQAAIGLDKELYQLLQKKELEEEALQKHIEKINDSYDKVIKSNETFNKYTEEYNEQKKAFYEATDLNVEYSEEDKDVSGSESNDSKKEENAENDEQNNEE